MRIIEGRLHRARLPLVHSFETSSHRKASLEHILVSLATDDGMSAWGEIASPSDPFYSAESVDTCQLIAQRYLLPAIVGAEVTTVEELMRPLNRIRGNNFAKAGFDIAAWSLVAARDGVSVASALGGSRSEVVAGVSLGIEPTIDELLGQVDLQADAGYPRVKLKIRPGWDLEPVRAVRAAHPALTLQVDANGAYRGADADDVAALVALDGEGLAMIEQPFDAHDFLAHADLQHRIQTPVCLDESIDTVADLETALRLDAARVINIKVSRMGGLTPARAAHDRARHEGIPVWCGGMHEFGVGRAANLALSSLDGFTLPSDVSGSDKYYERDITRVPILADHGHTPVPTGVALGVDVDTEFLAEITSETVTLTA